MTDIFDEFNELFIPAQTTYGCVYVFSQCYRPQAELAKLRAAKVKSIYDPWTIQYKMAGINLCMCPANERRRYIVTSSLIGWAHTQNDPWTIQYKMVLNAGQMKRIISTWMELWLASYK